MKQHIRSNASRIIARPVFTAGGSLSRAGLTVLEVLFSMGIILVGLVGIAAMVPFAGRQAAESYKISHGLASGANTVSMFQGDQFIVPRIERPWQLVDDEYPKGSPNSFRSQWPASLPSSGEWAIPDPMGATNCTYYSSFARLYDGGQARSASLYRYHIDKVFSESSGAVASLNVRQKIALAQNRALGQAFCMDPLFYAEQMNVPGFNQSETKIMRGDWGNFRRNRFPYYDERFPVSMNPFEYPRSGEFASPRLFRISYRDSSLPISSNHISDTNTGKLYLDKSWVRGDAAKLTSTMESRDLVSEESDLGVPLRQFNALSGGTTYNDVIKSVENGNMISWLATVVPSDGTTMVNPLSIDATRPGYLQGMDFFPESYDVSVVVFGKRNVNELTTTALQDNSYATFRSANVLPSSERLARVMSLSTDSGTSGTFEVELGSYNSPTASTLPDDPTTVSAKVVVGDWIMLSRYTYDDPTTTNVSTTFPIREIHRWYRVVGVTGPNIFPRRIRVAGAPWDWSVHELEAMKRLARTNPGLTIPSMVDPTVFPTVATLLSDVVSVYQRTLQVKK